MQFYSFYQNSYACVFLVFRFCTFVNNLEVMMQNLINSAFSSVKTVQQGVELLYIFSPLLSRKVSHQHWHAHLYFQLMNVYSCKWNPSGSFRAQLFSLFFINILSLVHHRPWGARWKRKKRKCTTSLATISNGWTRRCTRGNCSLLATCLRLRAMLCGPTSSENAPIASWRCVYCF